MSVETRMIKFKPLHNEINKEIESRNRVENSKTNIISEKLRILDKSFFEPKIRSFTKSNDVFKPYLDKDRSNLLISEEIKFELRRYLNELIVFESKHKKTQTVDKRLDIIDNTKKVVIKDVELQKMYLNISNEVNEFNEGIRTSSDLNKKSLATSSLPPAAIEEILQGNQEYFYASAKQASIKLEKSIVTLESNNKNWFTKKMNKMAIIVGITLVVLMLFSLILFSVL